jgi:hypothetical protein
MIRSPFAGSQPSVSRYAILKTSQPERRALIAGLRPLSVLERLAAEVRLAHDRYDGLELLRPVALPEVGVDLGRRAIQSLDLDRNVVHEQREAHMTSH